MSRNPYVPIKVLPKFTNKANKYHIVSCFLAQKGNKLNIARMANQLKILGNKTLIKEVFDNLYQHFPNIERTIWGNFFPKNVAALGNGDNSYFFKPKSLEYEVSWCIF